MPLLFNYYISIVFVPHLPCDAPVRPAAQWDSSGMVKSIRHHDYFEMSVIECYAVHISYPLHPLSSFRNIAMA